MSRFLYRHARHIVMVFAVLSSVGGTAVAQLTAVGRVADLNPGSAGSYPTNLTLFVNDLLFSAYTVDTGTELWNYDGTNITLVADINNTTSDIGFGTIVGNSSFPSWLTPFDGMLCFSAFDPYRGGELWRYDGSNVNRVADINPDANDTIKTNPASSWPNQLTVVGTNLFFSANGGSALPNYDNYELWKYDGTTVSLAADIHPETGTNFSSYPTGLTSFNNALYFMADDGSTGYELWKATATNVIRLADINPGGEASSSYPKGFTAFNGNLYFQAYNEQYGYELWRTDGTVTTLVTNLNAGAASSFPEYLTVFQNALYFQATDGVTGSELWRFDGQTATLAANINPTGDSFPKNLTVLRDQLCFAADDGTHGWELWEYDGSQAKMVADINPSGDSFPEWLTVFNDSLYFVASNTAAGYELWRYDGSFVSMVTDLNTGPGSSYPQSLKVYGNLLCFTAAEDGVSDWELWRLEVFPFRITRVSPVGNGMNLTWSTLGGRTNFVLASGVVAGPYQVVSGPLVIPGTGQAITNFTEVGVMTNSPIRFYKVLQP